VKIQGASENSPASRARVLMPGIGTGWE
jgi:hypothetical protein